MDVDTRLLRAFVAVADERSVTRAAARLSLTQPALSKQLRRLEDQLGIPLLTRDAHGVELTTAGAALLPAACDTLDAWAAGQRRVLTAARAGLPQITVGFIANAADELTSSIIRRFTAARPSWRVELQQSDWSDPTAGLTTGTTDAALLRLPVPDTAPLRVQPLFSEPRTVAMATAHPLATRKSLTMTDLLDEPVVAPRGPVAWRDWWIAAEHRGDRSAVIGAVVGTPDEWLQAIANGAGISIAFASAARYYQPPNVTYRPIDGLPPSTVAVAHRNDTRNPAVDDFVLACQQAVAAANTRTES